MQLVGALPLSLVSGFTMKKIAILIVLAGTVLSIQAALPNIGNCSYEGYNSKIRTCTTKFIKDLQKNPKEDCKVHLDSLINCSAVAVQPCLPTISAEDMREGLKLQLTEELMCKKAGLQYADQSQSNVTFPCNITMAEYVTKNKDCTDKFLKKWSADRADPTMCSEYHNVKKCLKNNIDKYCQFEGESLELFNYQYDDYNPFCPNNADPTSPATPASLTSPTSKISSTTVSKAVIVISLVVAAIQAF